MSAPNNLSITPKAVEKFRGALAEEGLDGHAIRISAEVVGSIRLQYGLDFAGPSEKQASDLELRVDGLSFWVDPHSAKVLDGASIDYVDGHGAAAGFKFNVPDVTAGWIDPIAGKLQVLLDSEINPGIASHGGHITLVDYRDGTAYVQMGGGCQGCGMASVTLRQGVEARVKQAIPEVKTIVDSTDHTAGNAPYYKKG